MSVNKKISIRLNEHLTKITIKSEEDKKQFEVFFDGGPVNVTGRYCEFTICKDGKVYNIKIDTEDLVDLLFHPDKFKSQIINEKD